MKHYRITLEADFVADNQIEAALWANGLKEDADTYVTDVPGLTHWQVKLTRKQQRSIDPSLRE